MKKSQLRKIWKWLLPIPAIVLGTGGYLTYNAILNKDKKGISGAKPVNNDDKEHTINDEEKEYLNIASWNIANFGQSSSNKTGFRIKALKEIILKENLEFISVQEVGYEDWDGIKKLVEVLGDEFAYAKSPMGLLSQNRKNSKESYAIIYKRNRVKLLDDSKYFKGKEIEFTRPLWFSKWEILANKQAFWIINGHLDAPGKSSTKGVNESENPTVENYKWKGQGDQEVKEFLDIKNALNDLKQKDKHTLIIFNGDTNIKKENFTFASDYYTKLGYENNYHSNKYEDLYATSLYQGKAYANPYDKFIVYDPNNSFIENKFEKFDLINVFKNILDRKEYGKLYNQSYNKNLSQPSDSEMAFKISDHTFIKAKIKIIK